jgi:hypothetical protein
VSFICFLPFWCLTAQSTWLYKAGAQLHLTMALSSRSSESGAHGTVATNPSEHPTIASNKSSAVGPAPDWVWRLKGMSLPCTLKWVTAYCSSMQHSGCSAEKSVGKLSPEQTGTVASEDLFLGPCMSLTGAAKRSTPDKWLKQQNFIFSKFWRQKVPDQDANWVGSSEAPTLVFGWLPSHCVFAGFFQPWSLSVCLHLFS